MPDSTLGNRNKLGLPRSTFVLRVVSALLVLVAGFVGVIGFFRKDLNFCEEMPTHRRLWFYTLSEADSLSPSIDDSGYWSLLSSTHGVVGGVDLTDIDSFRCSINELQEQVESLSSEVVDLQQVLISLGIKERPTMQHLHNQSQLLGSRLADLDDKLKYYNAVTQVVRDRGYEQLDKRIDLLHTMFWGILLAIIAMLVSNFIAWRHWSRTTPQAQRET
jgi:hypothetical protein